MEVFFLKAAKPLCKVFTQNADGTVHKTAYPLVKNFTSFKEAIGNTHSFFELIKRHAAEGHCLLKGTLKRDLIDESRQNTTVTDAPTEWLCLDFDRLTLKTPLDAVLQKMGLNDVSYVRQFSASQGLAGNEDTFSAHVFMRLATPLPAPFLKSWLMEQNYNVFKGDLVLSRTKTFLHYPLDISACQNDKLIYIAPPVFKAPLKDPIEERFEFVEKHFDAVPDGRIDPKHIETLKRDEREILNALRDAEGLPKRRAGTTWVNGVEITQKPDQCTVTGIKDCGEYVRLNLNGGDSWAYWHYAQKFDLIYDFKTGTAFKTQELVPEYYKRLLQARRMENASPNKEGNLVLAFRELKTGLYYNGIYQAKEDSVQIYPAKSEKQLADWLAAHGRMMDEFVPIWDIVYEPRKNEDGKYWHIDPETHRINMFNPSRYMEIPAKLEADFPLIYDVIYHALGNSENLAAHFVNWFAAIFQRKARPITAWVLHGIEGTGKGFLFNKILKPLLGDENVISITTRDLRDNFNSFLENKLLVFVDEVDVDDFGEKGLIAAKLRNAITEPTIAIRPMRQVVKQVPNTLSFMFASNRPQPVFIPPTDRRYNVGEFQHKKLPPPNANAIAKELDNFAAMLNGFPVKLEVLNKICYSKAREEIQQASVNSIERVAQDIKNGHFEAFWAELPNNDYATALPDLAGVNSAYRKLMFRMGDDILTREGKSALTREELYILFEYLVGKINPAPAKFGRLLALHGLKTAPTKLRGELFRGVRVDWYAEEELKSEIAHVLKENNFETGEKWRIL